MKKSNLMPPIVLSAICLIVALALALINSVTAPIIAEAQNQAANAALIEVLPEGKNFKEITVDDKYPGAITKAYSADGGFVFQATVTGKSSGLVIMIGVNSEGKIVATKVISSEETKDYAAKVFPLFEGTNGKYRDKTLDGFEAQLVSGATLTSKAYGEAVKAALQAFVIANGGEVDIRTPEQIIEDNCNTALGTEGAKFTKWFATETLNGIDAVYTAESGDKVFVLGESFIGVKADGTIVGTHASSEAVLAANTKLAASTLTEITELPTDVNKTVVKKVYATSSGNYVFELEAKGYQALFDWGDGTVIKIKLSISADGRIIDCLTVSHNESKGFGDVCATEDYYKQFRGASASDIILSVTSPDGHADQIPPECDDIGVIASATFTTYGYQKAIKAAFAAFELLTQEGGN